jgi:CO/xanthine dehydrogenase FAD-binding subunit
MLKKTQLDYQRPSSLIDALVLLQQGYVPIAGGTDYYPGKVGKPLNDPLLDLSAIAELKHSHSTFKNPIDRSAICLSALTTWRDCQLALESGRLPRWCLALAQSAKDVGGWQIQNRGTLGGNLCNASPAADGVVALIALGADVVLVSQAASQKTELVDKRQLAISDFVLGNRHTARKPNELLSQIQLPAHSDRARSVFLKLGHRKYLVISIVMVAVLIDFDQQGVVTTCRVAVGACAKAAMRVLSLEALIVGQHRDNVIDIVKNNITQVLAAITPIDDVRGTALYRQSASQELVLRAFAEVLS